MALWVQGTPSAALLPALALLAGCGAAALPPPPAPQVPARRILSLNPCADALLREIALPHQILAISHYSHDPRATSVPLAWARRYPATSGTAEEVVALGPDLVVAGPHVAAATLATLRRIGAPLVQLGVPRSVEESLAQVELVGDAVGQPVRAGALAHRVRAAVARARVAGPPVDALVWQGGGLVPGAGTLIDELLTLSGHRNMAADHGLGAWGVLGLERLVAAPPAILFSDRARGQADRLLAHPVVGRLAGHIAVEPYPARLMHCAGPTIVEALDHLAAARPRAAGG